MSRVGVVPTNGGRFLLRQNNQLSLFSGQFHLLASFPLDRRDRDIRGLGFRLGATPGQRSVVIQKWSDSDAKVKLMWLDPETLALRRSQTLSQPVPGGMFSLLASDAAIAQDLFVTLRPGLYAADFDKPLQRVFASDVDHAMELTFRFVGDRTILVSTLSDFFLIHVNGDILFRGTVPRKRYTRADYSQESEDESRLAVPIMATVGVNNEMLNLAAHPALKGVMIYDLPSMRLACELDGKNLSLRRASAFALSPHGGQLALIRNGAVELYRLPWRL